MKESILAVMKKSSSTSELVYSTADGRICGSCGKPQKTCVCRAIAENRVVPGDGIVRVARETKGRGGKGVTIVTGLPLSADKLDDLAKELKKKCGCGGTVKNGVVEIQGEQRDLLAGLLAGLGFTVKRVGG